MALVLGSALALTGCTGGGPATPSPTPTPTAAPDYFANPSAAQAFLDSTLAHAGTNLVVQLTVTPTRVAVWVPGTKDLRRYATDGDPIDEWGNDVTFRGFPASSLDVTALITTARTTLAQCGMATPTVTVWPPYRLSPTVSYACDTEVLNQVWLDNGQKVAVDLATAEGIDAILARLKGGMPATVTKVELSSTPGGDDVHVTFPTKKAFIFSFTSKVPERLIMNTVTETSSTPTHVFDPGLIHGAWVAQCAQAIFGAEEYRHLELTATADGHATAKWGLSEITVPAHCQQI